MINKNSNIKMNLMKYIHSLYIGLLSLLFVGCQEEQLNNMQTGGFLISLNDDVSTEVTTKSTPAELGEPATENFKLKIVNETTNDPLYDGAYKSGPIPASAGSYTVTASFGDNSLVALDEPYYKGEETRVVVEEGKTTSVQLACKVANALASVIFPDATEMAKIYESYWVKVAVENYSVKLKPNSTNSAYFQVGKEVSFYFEGEKLNGQSVSAKLEHDDLPTTFEAADHYTLTLTFNDDLTLDISKVKATTATIYETIPMEWLPKPKVEAEGFEGNELSFVETENKTASIKLVTATALQDLKLKFNFEDEQFISSLPKEEYVLSNPEDKQAIETALGITLPEIGTTDASLDLSPLLAKLQTNAGETTKNSIEIDAKANNRWSSEEIEGQETPNLKYTLKCEKPEFTVSVYPGNIWTKEFTMNALMEDQVTKGDFSKLSENMKYQFSTNGESGWIDLSDDLCQTNLTPGTTYYIRGLYRDMIPSEIVELKTYDAFNIPNSSLDEGYKTTYPKKENPLYSFDGDWIGTRNTLTCHTKGVNAFYVSKSSTIPVADNGSTVAYMMTIGWGEGNTCDFGEKRNSVINNVSSGLVCVGDYSADGDVIYPKAANIRPTALSFTYKALPYNGDEYLIDISLINLAEDGTETEIGKGELLSGETINNYTTSSIKIFYDELYKEKRITHIRILFKAGTKEDRDHLENEFRDASFWDGYANAYIIGSQFWLDSFTLIYDR